MKVIILQNKYKRHGSEFIENEKFMYANEYIIVPIIMHCKISTPKTVNFKSKLRFTQYDIRLNKEQSVLKTTLGNLEGENMETQYSVLNYRVDLYFHDNELTIEVDEKGHKDRNKDYEKQIQKKTETKLSCEFSRINPDKKTLTFLKSKTKYLGTLKNHLKN